MANAYMDDQPHGRTKSDVASIDDADSLVTELEKSLRTDPKPSPEADAEIRARLIGLYLSQLRDPLSAAMHVEALLERGAASPSVLHAAAALVEHRPIAARIAEKLSAAYARVGAVESEIAMLSKELSVARPERQDAVKRRLAELRFSSLDDVDGALDLLEPLIQRNTADDALRARYLQMAAPSARAARAIRTVMRASRSEKDGAARARILCDLGELYLKEGELRRARQAFVDALPRAAPDPKGLAAARHVLHLETEAGDPKILGAALELLARGEPDPSKRRVAAERLLALAETRSDDDRAIVAWRALLDSPRRTEALDELSTLLERRNDVAGLVEVLRAREPSADTLGRMIPLLEKGGLWADLAGALEQRAALVPPNESAAILARLGRVRMSRLGDGDGAVAAFRRSLEADPKNAASRAALEKMMSERSEAAHRTQAADLLERVYRAEESADGIARVLVARAEMSATPADKLSALGAAFEAARTAGFPRSRLLSLARSGIAEAARHEPRALSVWLARFPDLTADSNDPSRDADILLDALGDRAVDGPERAALACAAIDALLASGRATDARAFCSAALSSSPASIELLQRYDRVVGPGEAPRERLGRYQTALDRAADPGARRRILGVLAAICREDLDDLPRAIELFSHVLRDEPRNLDALLGLVSAYERLENPDAVFAEIESALCILDGPEREAVLLRKADALSKFGDREQSATLRRELLAMSNLASSSVASIVASAYEDDQLDVYRKALEIQANADDPATRMQALERLGDFHFERLGDRRAAVDSWKPAARLYTKDSPGDEHARELYERVLEASPDDREAAWRLVELYAKDGEWARVPEVYGALLRSEGGVEAGIEKLLGLERDATRAGAVDEYVSMVDETVPRLDTHTRESHQLLLRAKARILSADAGHEAEASAAHKQVTESFGVDEDIQAFATFIEARGSADDRQADLRWLFEFRANREPNRLELLREWSKIEEEYGDPERAVRIHEQILDRAPGDHEALEAVARLKRAAGDFEGCLVALRALREGAEPKRAADLDLGMARLLASELDRPLDAALTVAPYLLSSPRSSDVVAITRRALAHPESRARAIELVEQSSRDGSPDATRENLRLLVEEAGGDAAVPESARSSWYARLIELCSDDLWVALEVAKDGVRDVPNAGLLWEALEASARRADRPEEAAEAFRGAIGDGSGRGMALDLCEAIGRRMVDLLDESSSDSEEVLRTLEQILERVPRARWAIDRVKLVLSAQGRWEELFELYERAIASAVTDRERAELLDEAAVAARDLARAPDRAIAFLEMLRELRPEDAPVRAALERLYERGGKTLKLIELLSAGLESMGGAARLQVSHRIASAWLDLGEVDSAGGVVDAMLERGSTVEDVKDVLERLIAMFGDGGPISRTKKGVAERAISLLSAHYAAAGLTHDSIRVMKTTLALSRDPAQRARCARDLVRVRLESAGDAPGAFSSTRAALKGDLGDDPALAEVAARTLLDAATKAWTEAGSGDGGANSDAARAAWDTILELSELHFRAERPERAVTVLRSGAELPFPREERRELRSRIAFALADRLNDPGRASTVFGELIEEDAGDAVARACADRLGRLLQAAGRDRDLAELWGRRGEFARAAELWEALGEPERAVVAHTAAAALGSEVAVEALGRLHAESGRWREAAETLEWGFGAVTGEARVRVGLALADAYVKAGSRDVARTRLAELVRTEPGAWSPRARLLELYREDAIPGALADLLVDTASVTVEREPRLELMREAVGIRLRQLKDPDGAVAVATAILELDPASVRSRLDLGEALDAAGRHGESVTVLREAFAAEGVKRSKHAAALHRAIASALFHAGLRAEALTELGSAAKLNPTDPNTLYELSRLAGDEGEHELAERTLRALVLTLHHAPEPTLGVPTRAEVYLDLSRIVELRGDTLQAKDLVESAFDSSLHSAEQGARLERALEERGRHDLLALALERRLRSRGGPETTAASLDALVTLWEGPLGRREDTLLVIRRHAELLGRDAEESLNVTPRVWAACVRACSASGDEGARVDAVRRHIATLERAAERAVRDGRDGRDGATTLLLEAAALSADGVGDVERAATVTEALLAEDPANLEVWHSLRDFLGRLGRRDRLVEMAQAALASPLAALASPAQRRWRLDLAKLLMEDPAGVDPAILTLRQLLEDESHDDAARELLADVLEREGRYDELAVVLSEALGGVDVAGQPHVSMRLARALEGASRGPEAARVYARVAEGEEATAEQLRIIAARLDALGSDRLAGCLERLMVLVSGPEAGKIGRRLVELRSAEGDRPGTIRALASGFASRPEDTDFREHLVRAYEEDGRWDQVAAVLQRAAAHEPSNRALLQRLVEAHQRNLDPGSALAVLNGALRESPSDADLLRMRAWIHEAEGRLDDALGDLERAYAVDPGLFDDLIAALAQAAVRGDDQRSLELVDLLLAHDRAPDARSTLEALLERRPDHARALERLASLSAAEGDWASARDACHRLLPLLDGDPAAVARVALTLADACEERGGLEDARDALERALVLVPGSAEIRTRLLRACEASGDDQRLADLLEAEAEDATTAADKASLMLRAAELLLRAGKSPAHALALVEASRAIDPPHPPHTASLLIYAQALGRLGRHTESESTLRDLLKVARGRDPGLASQAHLELARLQLSRDEMFEAFDGLGQALNTDPKNDEAAFLWGLVALDLDDERTATRALRAATAARSTLKSESKAVALYHLACIARGKGDLRRAKQMATSAVAENGNDSRARALLETL